MMVFDRDRLAAQSWVEGGWDSVKENPERAVIFCTFFCFYFNFFTYNWEKVNGDTNTLHKHSTFVFRLISPADKPVDKPVQQLVV